MEDDLKKQVTIGNERLFKYLWISFFLFWGLPTISFLLFTTLPFLSSFQQLPNTLFYLVGGMIVFFLMVGLFSIFWLGILLVIISIRVRKIVGKEKLVKILKEKYGMKTIFIKCLPLMAVGVIITILIMGIKTNILTPNDWILGIAGFILWIASFLSMFSFLRWLVNDYFFKLKGNEQRGRP